MLLENVNNKKHLIRPKFTTRSTKITSVLIEIKYCMTCLMQNKHSLTKPIEAPQTLIKKKGRKKNSGKMNIRVMDIQYITAKKVK